MRKSSPAFSPTALAAVLFEQFALPVHTTFRLALSGGVDSMVLLHALAQLRAQYPFQLHAVHIHHGLQTQADSWAAHCRAQCEALGVSCRIVHVNVDRAARVGVEAAARAARYAALAQDLSPGEVVLTAHHRDDQAETLLLRLLRGAGVAGLAAIPARAAFGAGELVRPLLAFARTALCEYADAHGLAWVEDPSNLDTRFDRNFIRTHIMPRLGERWPAAAAAMARAAQNLYQDATLLTEIAQDDLGTCCRDDGALSITAMSQLSPARRRNLLRHWLTRCGFAAPSLVHLQELERATAALRTRHARVAWPGVEVRRYRDALFALRSLPPVPASLDLPWDVTRPLQLPSLGLELQLREQRGCGLARARLAGADVRVRLRRGGECCRLSERGHTFELRKLFQEAAVPPWERVRTPLIHVDGQLAAVGDRWVCAPFAATAGEVGLAVSVHRV